MIRVISTGKPPLQKDSAEAFRIPRLRYQYTFLHPVSQQMELCDKPRTEHGQTVGRKQKRRRQLDHAVFHVVVDETENAHKDEKHRQNIQQHSRNMQGQRAEPDQERENKHNRSQQDFQNKFRVFINSFAYILQFNRSRGKDAAEMDGIGAAAHYLMPASFTSIPFAIFQSCS
ncbi:MAG: hypothetical protein V8S08_10560 [Lachnoclostridium sp.]